MGGDFARTSPGSEPGSSGTSFMEKVQSDLARTTPQQQAPEVATPHPPVAPAPPPPETGYGLVGTRNIWQTAAMVLDEVGETLKEKNEEKGEWALYVPVPMNDRIALQLERLFEAAFGKNMDPAKAFWGSMGLIFGPQVALCLGMVFGKDAISKLRSKAGGFLGKMTSKFSKGEKDGQTDPAPA